MKRLLGLATSAGARDTYILTIGNLTDAFVAFLFTVISFHLLSSSEFGLFSAFNNLIFSISMLLDLGLSQSLLYYLPKQTQLQRNSILGTAIALRLLIASLFALILIISAPFIILRFFPDSSVWHVYASGLGLIMASFIDILIYGLQGFSKFFLSVVVSTTYSVSRLIAILFFTSISYSSLNALWITVCGPIVGIAIAVYILKPSLPDLSQVKKLFQFGGYMGLYRVCQIITLRSDVQIVLTTLGATLAGVYSVAARMGNFYPLIIVTLTSLFSSRLRAKDEISHDFIKKSLFLTLIVVGVMLFVSWQAPLIINLLFGAKAGSAGLLYRYLTLAYIPLMVATFPLAILVFHMAKTKIVGTIGVLQVITMLTVSFLLTSSFQELGPIIGLGVANSLVFVVSCYKVITLWK